MIIGALLQATAYTRAHIIVARVVSGSGMGIISSAIPVFQSEVSPKANRGLCMYTFGLDRVSKQTNGCYADACIQLSTKNLATAMVYVWKPQWNPF